MTIHLHAINDVFFRVTGEPNELADLGEYFTYPVPGAYFMPAYRHKMWDGKIRFFNRAKSMIYRGLVDRIADFARDRGHVLDYIDNFHPPLVRDLPEFIQSLNLPFAPRDYQIDAVETALKKERALLLSPTASGKSMIIYLLIQAFLRGVPDRKILIVVPTITLVHQLAADFVSYGFDGELIHKIHGGTEKNTEKRVVITTWQSIHKLPESWFSDYYGVIGDEAHLFKANCLKTILEKMKLCPYRWGLTGSLDGSKSMSIALEGLFGPLKRVTTTIELMDKGQLAALKIVNVVLQYPEKTRKETKGLKYKDEINFLISNDRRSRMIAALAASLKGNVLVLYQYVEGHGKRLYDLISAIETDRPIHYIHGKIAGERRNEIRGEVDRGSGSILVASVQTYGTGINIKNINHIILASPSKSRIRLLQSIGRGLRISEQKDQCNLFDVADNLTWKAKTNYTMLHHLERIKIYNEEQFDYQIVNMEVKG